MNTSVTDVFSGDNSTINPVTPLTHEQLCDNLCFEHLQDAEADMLDFLTVSTNDITKLETQLYMLLSIEM